MDFVANLELQFTDLADNVIDRITAATAAGVMDLEFWRWQDLDVALLERTVKDTGARINSFVIDWSIPITRPENAARYAAAWEDSLRLAERLGVRNLVSLNGPVQAEFDDAQQIDIVAAALRRITPQAEQAGVTILLEPLNTKVDHAGTWLDTTPKAAQLIDAVGSPNLGILFDVYHAQIEGEDFAGMITRYGDKIRYFHLADMPGRNEPGGADIDWTVLSAAMNSMKTPTRVGLEYVPTKATVDSLRQTTAFLQGVGITPVVGG